MSPDATVQLYAYHRWANRQLFEVTAGLGDAVAGREVGPQRDFVDALGPSDLQRVVRYPSTEGRRFPGW
jgi:hypothetical protein